MSKREAIIGSLVARQQSMGASDTVQKSQPSHRVRLPGSEWSLWRDAAVRGSGFPINLVLEISAHECALAADQLVLAEEKAQRAAPDRTKSSLEDFRQKFGTATSEISNALYRIASMPRFREAIIWQNRHALHASFDAYLRMARGGADRTSVRRKRENQIASYLQRYCTKNDTIGFFGPVGWTRWVSGQQETKVMPGRALIAERNVYFEVWCIDALAEALNRGGLLQPWVAPRRSPLIHVEGAMLYAPNRQPVNFSVEQAAIIQACDGEQTAEEIATDLIGNGVGGLRRKQEVYGILEALHQFGLITWTLEAPIELHPELALRRMLARVGDPTLRAQSLAALDEIEKARRYIESAAGNPDRLDEAMADLEATFTRLTQKAATRSAGQTYAARTLVYEDCLRGLNVELGQDLLEALGSPLSLLLTSARWFTYRIAQAYRKAFVKLYAELARAKNSPAVELADFWLAAQPLLFKDKQMVEGLLLDFQRRWAGILKLSGRERRVSYTCEDLREEVEAAFDAPNAGWNSARYHSPDFMIAAASPQAIQRGEYSLVMGEIHLASNTLGWPVFLVRHPDRNAPFEAARLDLPAPRLLTTIPKWLWASSGRLFPSLVTDKDICLEIAADPRPTANANVLPLSAFLVELKDDVLIARSRDGRHCYDMVEVLGQAITNQVANRFEMFGPESHLPRVSFDRMVVSRESWNLSPTEMPFIFEKQEQARFIEARRWLHRYGVPRLVFARSPLEAKPFYIDFESPVYINILAKAIRRVADSDLPTPTITITEMLPTPDQVWLPDYEGRRYTSEIRTVAFDLKQ